MRICFLLESYHPRTGGTPTQARLLAEDLAAAGDEVLVVTRRWERSASARETVGGIRILRIPPVGFGQLKKWGMLLTCLPVLVKRRREYDVIYVAGLRVLGLAAVLVGRRLGKRCVLRAVSCGELSGEFFEDGIRRLRLGPARALLGCLLAWRNRRLRRADALVAISRVVADELKAGGIPAERVHCIPNGVDTGTYRPATSAERTVLRGKLDLPNDAPVIVYSGRLVSYKGIPTLADAWPSIRKEHPGARLLLVGSGGNDIANCEADIRARAARDGWADSVRFTGDVHNVHDYLRAADLFVFPTENESFGISLVEAMSCGLPVVTTLVGGISDYAGNGCNAVAVEPGDAQELARAVNGLLADRERAALLGRNARETAVSRFSRGAIAGRYRALFGSLVRPGSDAAGCR